MAFPDPQTLDASYSLVPPPMEDPGTTSTGLPQPSFTPGPISLPRTGLDLDAGNFRSADSSRELVISHQYAKRIRHTARVNFKTLVPDVVSPANNALYTMSAYLVVDAPTYGIPLVDQTYVTLELINWLYTRQEPPGVGQFTFERLIGGES